MGSRPRLRFPYEATLSLLDLLCKLGIIDQYNTELSIDIETTSDDHGKFCIGSITLK